MCFFPLKNYREKLQCTFKYKRETDRENIYVDIKNQIFIKFDALFFRINLISFEFKRKEKTN